MRDGTLPPAVSQETLPFARPPVGSTAHCDLGTDVETLEWNDATLPGLNHDGIVGPTTEGGERQPSSFSLFHQPRCPNIVQESLMTR